MAEYIKREDALDAVLFSLVGTGHQSQAIYAIRDAPTADVVEVKHGEWEIVKGSNGKEKMVCTNCRHQQDLHSTFTYCPNCGARMDGKDTNVPTK